MTEAFVLAAAMAGLLAGFGLGVMWKNRPTARLHSQELLGDRYFRGINYLLNEQPDKALDVFLQLAEVTHDTVETHLALGSLFRRRGEMDNAIRCHQNIIQQEELDDHERNQALLQLGEDYLRAGLLDRAEELFADLAGREIATRTALERLLNIFQQEQEWERAVRVARQLQRVTGDNLQPMVAQFYCELCQQERSGGHPDRARRQLDAAAEAEPDCSRIWILRAELAREAGETESAITCYQRAIALDRNVVPLVLEPLLATYEEHGDMVGAARFLQDWLTEHCDTSAVLAAASLTRSERGADEARRFLERQLARSPTVGKLRALLDLDPDTTGGLDNRRLLAIMRELNAALADLEGGYQCRVCGLTGNTHHWQCPGCRSWSSTLPNRGALGE